jgi:hypothetical protein
MESKIEAINRMRCALEYDFWLIEECLQIYFAFEKGKRENISEGMIFRNKDYANLERVLKQNIDHTVVIHFWNIIGEINKTCRHNIHTYCAAIQENLDPWVKTFFKIDDEDDLDEIKRDILENTHGVTDYVVQMKSRKNSLYNRIHNWRDNVFAHFDDEKNPGIMYIPLLKSNDFTILREQFIRENHIDYIELDQEIKSFESVF